ncbi:MAG: hypothetical protein QNJ46_09590 [Leptolyngbyaceae cyanobacterium MO_188.B28]|nr:hypothetical protein [Leptolyngbyaceae cyanobacterium MO_188.B28]
MKKFCVLTTGRTGSTSLMKELEQYSDIAVPNKTVDCEDNELLHPNRITVYMSEYSRLRDRPIKTNQQLVDAFYAHSQGYPYAGFKSMPRRHEPFEQFIAQPNIQFIVLIRKDVLSTVASFILATKTGNWRRTGGPPSRTWIFQECNKSQVDACLTAVQDNIKRLNQIPGAIKLTYEDLCNPAYENPNLNQYFQRRIALSVQNPPTSGKSHVQNWEEFKHYATPRLERV